MTKLKNQRTSWPILLLILLLISWLSYSFYQAYQPTPFRMQGQIEAQHYNISSKVPGRIEQVLVKKGDNVSKGQMVFTLLSPEIEAKMQQAQAAKGE